MALQWQLTVIVFALVLNMSAAIITCTEQSVSTSVGQQTSVGGSCTLPVGGCNPLSVGGKILYTWAPQPIVGKYSIDMANSTGTIKLGGTFWGFDNMIGDREAVTQTFTQLVNCTTTGNAQETQLFNITVRMGKSTTNTAALKPPASIPVGCLVAEEETRVLVNFGTPNASAQYHSLSTGWKYNDELPLVASRPLSAWRGPPSTATWDAGSQQILRSIEAGPNSSSLVLVLKPSSSQTGLRGSGGVSWKVCMIPGDGYNYYPELCTGTFPVMGSQAECDATPPTSGAAPLRKPVAQFLVMTFVVFCLASMRQEK